MRSELFSPPLLRPGQVPKNRSPAAGRREHTGRRGGPTDIGVGPRARFPVGAVRGTRFGPVRPRRGRRRRTGRGLCARTAGAIGVQRMPIAFMTLSAPVSRPAQVSGEMPFGG